LDKYDVLKRTEKRGGEERRSSLEDVVIAARQLGFDLQVGGGRAGGINMRYGSIGYAVMDINTNGRVKVYVSPHPNKDAPEDMRDSLNAFIDERDELTPKSFPISSYGHLEEPLEEIPSDTLVGYLEHALELIREEYYYPHFEDVA